MNRKKCLFFIPIMLSALMLAGGCRTGIQGLNTGFTKGLNDAVASVVEAMLTDLLQPLTGPGE
jgi:hypothetical protein